MKKNKMMRLASAMMVMTLMTTSVISGTFAKYVTSDSASDTARVAKWGITVQAGGNLFGKYYLETTDDSIAASSDNVASFNEDNVVAPGTKNDDGFTISINGKPEVDYTINAVVDADVSDADVDDVKDIFLAVGNYGVMVPATGVNAASTIGNYYVYDTVNGKYNKATAYSDSEVYYELHDKAKVETDPYYPLVWDVIEAGSDATIIGSKKLSDIASDIATALNSNNTAAKANEQIDASYKLTWSWAFEGVNDGADTILGNLAARDKFSEDIKIVKSDDDTYASCTVVDAADYNLDVAFGLKVTVSQVN